MGDDVEEHIVVLGSNRRRVAKFLPQAPRIPVSWNRSYVLSVIILVVGTAIGVACYSVVVEFGIKEDESNASNAAIATQSSLVSGFVGVTNLALVARYIEMNPDITCEDYDYYMVPLLEQNVGPLHAVGYVENVLHADRSSYESSSCYDVRDFFTQSTPDGLVLRDNFSEYYPILKITPLESNEGAILFDLASNSVRLETINKMKMTGEPAATGRITLVQTLDYGLLLMWPINGTSSFVYAVVRFTPAIDSILGDDLLEPFHKAFVFDITTEDTPVFIYQRNGFEDADYHDILSASSKHLHFDFPIADRTYRCFMFYNATPVSVPAILLLIVILLFTLFVSVFNLVLGKRFARIKELYGENKELEFQSELKTQFLSSVSHEIRTPLCGILSMADFLDETIPDANATEKEYIHNISSCGKMILDLVNSVLDLHKLEAGMMSLESEDMSVHSDVNTVIKMCSILALEKNVHIIEDIDPSLPANLLGDSLRIRQVFMNILTNAVKFSPQESEIRVKVRVKNKTSTHVIIHVDIMDNGIGIAEDKIGGLFLPFVQAESDTYRKFGGTGLGLSITKAIVQLMDGDIRVKSTIGKGTTFSFDMRFEITPPDVIMAQNTPIAYGGSAISLNQSPKSISSFQESEALLLVEDNAINTKIMSRYLTKWEVPFKHAENGLVAVNMCLEEPFCVILMDIQVNQRSIISLIVYRCR